MNVDWQPHSDVFSSIKAAAITDIVHVGLLMDIVHAMCLLTDIVHAVLLTDICTCSGLAYRYFYFLWACLQILYMWACLQS